MRDSHRYFIIVADTRQSDSYTGATHVGFWVPDIRVDNIPIPGAPSAWTHLKPNTVFVDDLPPLPVKNNVVESKWKLYMQSGTPESFSGTVFTSIPVLVRENKDNPPKPIAIFNVNIHTDCLWPRLLSNRWVNHAARIISPFLIPALHGTALGFANNSLFLDDNGLKKNDIELPNAYKFNMVTLNSTTEGGTDGTNE